MYNKLFTKILDSSIWLAPDPHRLVWITILAAMDEDGNVMMASAANLAARARVSLEHAKEAIAAFEGPDPDSGDPENEGRRIERFPGGWHVLNAAKYRALVTKAIIREQTRLRVQKHRSKGAGEDVKRTCNAKLTPSEAEAEATADTENTHSEPQASPTTAGRVCLLMKRCGISDVSPGHPDLLALLDAGATDAEFEHASTTASGRHKGFAYVLGMLKRQRTDALNLNLHKGTMPVQETPRQRAARARVIEISGGLLGADKPESIDAGSTRPALG